MQQPRQQTMKPGLMARIGAMVRYAATGQTNAWFGPHAPPSPQAPAEVAGRRFDFPTGYNLRSRPRQEEGITFGDLRALADHYDLLRLVIETRKDQLSKMAWTIQPKNPKRSANRSTKAITAFLASPDHEHNWDEWLRMLLEDLLVIDAPTLYPRYTQSGQLYALEPVDGATIKRVLDAQGRTPLPPEAAYQQILKGLPAVNYTQDELIYRPRNLRTHKVYGFSPVEQIILTVNIALRRQAHQLEYYQSGSMPDAIAGVPADWQMAQIKAYQDYWDNLMADDVAARRRLKFVPCELAQNFKEIKQPPLKDLYDEWLARVVCFAFSIEPTAFVAQTNRATAETIREQSLSEGLVPLQNWVKSLIDDVLARYLDAPDLTFEWVMQDAIDPMLQAQIHAVYLNAGVLSQNEVRAALGLTDIEPEPDNHEPLKETPHKHFHKRHGTALTPIDPDRTTLVKARQKWAHGLRVFLRQQARHLAQLIERTPLAELPQKITAWQFKDLEPFNDLTCSILTDVSLDGGKEALLQIGKMDDDLSQKLRERAAKWAQQRAAEMVGMKWVNGQLVPNPDATWVITDATRDVIQSLVQQALEEGSSAAQLASTLQNHEAFGRTRAMMIARTEIAKADIAGAMCGYRVSGVVTHKRWLSALDEKVSEECEACEAAGDIPLESNFPNGVDAPPNHPNCRCTIVPVLDDD